jgi:hypothetical protein
MTQKGDSMPQGPLADLPKEGEPTTYDAITGYRESTRDFMRPKNIPPHVFRAAMQRGLNEVLDNPATRLEGMGNSAMSPVSTWKHLSREEKINVVGSLTSIEDVNMLVAYETEDEELQEFLIAQKRQLKGK